MPTGDLCRAETFLLLADTALYIPLNEAILNDGRKSEVALTVLGAILLLVAASGRHPYGFYMVLRIVTTVGAVYWAWRVYKAGLGRVAWAFAVVAVLMNPLLPIRMQRTQWQPIDLGLGILLFVWSAYWLVRKPR